MALAVASTVVLIRVLSDHNDLHTEAGYVAVGWLVVEDLFTVIALVVIPALVGAAEGTNLAGALTLTAIQVLALVAVTALAGKRLIPRLLDYVAGTRSRELFTLEVLVLAHVATGSAHRDGSNRRPVRPGACAGLTASWWCDVGRPL